MYKKPSKDYLRSTHSSMILFRQSTVQHMSDIRRFYVPLYSGVLESNAQESDMMEAHEHRMHWYTLVARSRFDPLLP